MSLVTITPSLLFSSSALNLNSIPSSHSPRESQSIPVPDDHKTRSIWCSHCGHKKTFVMNCGSRTCEYCRLRSIKKTLNKKGLLKRIPADLRFMTLTVRSFGELSVERVQQCKNYFRRLIRLKGWKKYVTGGLYAIEVTKNQAGYHYHFHVIYSGKYFPYAELRHLWKKVTGDSYVVWISRIYDAEKSFAYVLKYISKVEKGNIDKTLYATAFKGIKLVQFFGTWCRLTGTKEKIKCPICQGDDWWSEFDEYRFRRECKEGMHGWEQIALMRKREEEEEVRIKEKQEFFEDWLEV